MPICDVIGTQSYWCPVTAVQLQHFVIVFMLLDCPTPIFGGHVHLNFFFFIFLFFVKLIEYTILHSTVLSHDINYFQLVIIALERTPAGIEPVQTQQRE